jgi:hypothetical protein
VGGGGGGDDDELAKELDEARYGLISPIGTGFCLGASPFKYNTSFRITKRLLRAVTKSAFFIVEYLEIV